MDKMLIPIAEQWQQISEKFAQNKNIFKANRGCIEDFIAKIENMRKSMMVLYTNLAVTAKKK